MFLDDQNYVGTHLLFIDADIGFVPENVERLIRANKDIACGIYPRKCIHWNQVRDAIKENLILVMRSCLIDRLDIILILKIKNIQSNSRFC
ncbi:MAG: hypothetical protein CM15mV91_250 [uncultured marine virus]|nr:MAG: hypothetical protein CM15mV91_250 [uncultured marine virus]